MLKKNDYNNRFADFRDVVLDMLLENPGAVKEFYDELHDEEEDVREDEIEWFRKDYTGRTSPLYYFTFIARGEFYTHFVVHDDGEDVDSDELYRYARENYLGYVHEFYSGDESAAPVFRYALLMMKQ